MNIFIRIITAILSFLMMACSPLVSFGNSMNVKFDIDTTQKGETVNNLMQSVNVWEMGNTFIDARNNHENDVFEFVEYVQLMQCSGGNATRDLFKDPYNTRVLDDYDFSRLIANCEGIVRLGAKPHLKLGNVPMKYSKDCVLGSFEVNIYPPDNYNVYYNYIAALAQALLENFGAEELKTWRFGVMTEFENSDWFMAVGGDAKESAVAFCKLYDYTVQALTDVLGEEICVGAHAMAVTEGLWDERIFIDHVAKGTNYANGKKGSKIDFLTASFYDAKPGEFTGGYTLPETVAHLKDYAESVGLDNLFYGVDEGRILCGNTSGAGDSQLLSRTVGYTWQAAYDARLWMQSVDSGLSYFSSWYYLSDGLTNGNPTVSYHVAKLFAGFDGMQRISVDGGKKMLLDSGSEAKAMAAIDSETGAVRIMAYSFKNDTDAIGTAEMQFNIKLADGNYTVRKYYINDDCNYFDEWCADRKTYNITDDCFSWSPDDPLIDNPTTLSAAWAREIYFNDLYDQYTKASKLVPVEETVTVENGTLVWTDSIPLNTVVFADLIPVE